MNLKMLKIFMKRYGRKKLIIKKKKLINFKWDEKF